MSAQPKPNACRKLRKEPPCPGSVAAHSAKFIPTRPQASMRRLCPLKLSMLLYVLVPTSIVVLFVAHVYLLDRGPVYGLLWGFIGGAVAYGAMQLWATHPSAKRIILVRHGESLGNVDFTAYVSTVFFGFSSAPSRVTIPGDVFFSRADAHT
jgi:hypothetical protein